MDGLMHQTDASGLIGSTSDRHAPPNPCRSFIKLIIQNPLNVPIEGPIVARVTAPNGPNSLVPPNTLPEISSYRLQGGLFFYKPGETVPGIDNKYTRTAKSSRGVPPPVITPGNTPSVANRTVTWTLERIPGAYIAGMGHGCVIDALIDWLSLTHPCIDLPQQHGRSSISSRKCASGPGPRKPPVSRPPSLILGLVVGRTVPPSAIHS